MTKQQQQKDTIRNQINQLPTKYKPINYQTTNHKTVNQPVKQTNNHQPTVQTTIQTPN